MGMRSACLRGTSGRAHVMHTPTGSPWSYPDPTCLHNTDTHAIRIGAVTAFSRRRPTPPISPPF